MSTSIVPGQRTWSMTRDIDGHRTYKIKYLVRGGPLDGPATAIQTPGLPRYGDRWVVDNDIDAFAWCRWDASVTPRVENEPNTLFEIEFTFSTRQETRACHQIPVQDPLLEPMKISGSFTRYTEEATHDRFDFPVTNSAHEQIRGPQVEFDKNRPTVKIEQPVAQLGLALFSSMIDTVNAFPLWGLPPRTIKLSNVQWERKFQGLCNLYYSRTLEFEIRYDTFDREILDEGSKVLNGRWDEITGDWILIPITGNHNTPNPSPYDPSHFIKAQDRTGNNCKIILDGGGLPAGPTVGAAGPFYVSLTDGNTGNTPPSANWGAVVGPINPPKWDATAVYDVGNLVVVASSDIYICRVDNLNNMPPSPNWSIVIAALANEPPPSLSDKGVFNSTTTYAHGDYVRPAGGGDRPPGRIFVQKYLESDFTLLGIPLIL